MLAGPSLRLALGICGRGTLLITKLDRLARSTPDLYRIVSQLNERGVTFKVVDDPSIDTASRTGKLIMGILALIAEFENDIRRERQHDGINKAKAEGVRFGPKPILTLPVIEKVKALRADGVTVPEIMRRGPIETPGGSQNEGWGVIVASRRSPTTCKPPVKF
jgi:DNA invertase Pin-like site-specific DNA recombinase